MHGNGNPVDISIHAPARGATIGRSILKVFVKFQSTPPRGGRPESLELSCTLIPKFQSTPPRGGRRETIRVVTPFVMHFNPRPREGGDSRPKHSPSPRSYFNPRPREGGDHLEWKGVYGCRISIHAPARGATKLRQYLSTIQTISIHAPARGATFGGRLEDFRPKFQSTPPRGGRQQRCTVLPADL